MRNESKIKAKTVEVFTVKIIKLDKSLNRIKKIKNESKNKSKNKKISKKTKNMESKSVITD